MQILDYKRLSAVSCLQNMHRGTAMPCMLPSSSIQVLCIAPCHQCACDAGAGLQKTSHLAHIADVDGVLAVLGDCEPDVAHAAGTPAGCAGGHPHSVAHPGFTDQHALRELLQQLVPCRGSKQGRSAHR